MANPPNPVLEKLGFARDERVVIIHTDDIGMCQASITAFEQLWQAGLVSSGAVMVPCPWFPLAAEYARTHPEADLGVHLTLTSEWRVYRWGPVSTRDPRSGMVDAEGFFYHTTGQAREHGEPDFVHAEMEAQVARARQLGMQPTHLDTHMGTVAHPKFLLRYLQVALKHRLPPLIFRMDEAGWMAAGLDAPTAAMAVAASRRLEEAGLPLLDHLVGLHLDCPQDRLAQAKAAIRALQPGITHFIIHPAQDTPELRAITPDWQARVADYETFLRADLRAFLEREGVQVMGYRRVQQLMPGPEILAALPG